MDAPEPVIRVLLAEDHPVVRVGLEELLGAEDGIEVVAAVGDGAAAVAGVAELKPDVVLLDISMPMMDGIEATRRIAESGTSTHIVILTASAGRESILRAIDAGALGYMLKDAPPDDLLDGIRAAARGDAPLDPKAARQLVADRHSTQVPQLTGREREVLELVAAGMPNKRIATRLEISEKTVKAHLTRVYDRIGVTDRTQAALWARKQGIGN
jgi:DNA-binding NarL/FixJ family response regulator